ncbi:flagellar export protein FliJ [Neptunicella marina]|uniref:Flagellar FliJ protein n=1 Tax=Neptunicella marina TaxID=2125989 RepID=A0A8J6ISX7_9ALTE|nr:flagellar export protein FliJ [Neptunicella marina]MBC3764996.1 flagellar export protein FliJ [Neptunicella marina]
MADKQLQQVLRWEQDKEDRLARDFQQAQQHWQLQRSKLSGLENYRLDYLRQLQQKGTQGLKALSFGQHQAFIGKLDKACEEQNKIIAKAQMVAEQRKGQWLQQQKKRKAVEMLLDKKRQIQTLHEARQEQKLLDEVSLQRFIRAQS